MTSIVHGVPAVLADMVLHRGSPQSSIADPHVDRGEVAYSRVVLISFHSLKIIMSAGMQFYSGGNKF